MVVILVPSPATAPGTVSLCSVVASFVDFDMVERIGEHRRLEGNIGKHTDILLR
jgi:hypothetical protein